MTQRVPRLFVYRDRSGGWRWRLKSSNGKIVAESGESYKRKPNRRTLMRVYEDLGTAANDL